MPASISHPADQRWLLHGALSLHGGTPDQKDYFPQVLLAIRANCCPCLESLDRRHIFGKSRTTSSSLYLVSPMKASGMCWGVSTSLATIQASSRKGSIRRSLGTKRLSRIQCRDSKAMVLGIRHPPIGLLAFRLTTSRLTACTGGVSKTRMSCIQSVRAVPTSDGQTTSTSMIG